MWKTIGFITSLQALRTRTDAAMADRTSRKEGGTSGRTIETSDDVSGLFSAAL